MRIPLNGSPARVIAEDVGYNRAWVDERFLVTLRDDDLVRIDSESGERVTLSRQVLAYTLAEGDLYFQTGGRLDPHEDGVWYLRATALRR